jgi:hypothetical protein
MSLAAHVILLPIAAMVALSAVVGGALLAQRTAEMRRRRIHPQSVATSSQMAARLERTNIADNFRNLFETPVLFYALCLALAITQSVTPGMFAATWIYVALRVLHSAIHCSTNRVMHRFAAFAAGFVLLIGMWLVFTLQLVGQA